jgi:endonuclease YncB( thermonuclease family)
MRPLWLLPFISLVFASLVFASASAAEDGVKGEAQVRDAVTLALAGARFRLSSIVPVEGKSCGGKDCAEYAAENLGPELAGHEVTCTKERRLGHGFFLARCTRGDGTDIATIILGKGLAAAEANAPPSYREAADKAKAEKKGLWAE